MIHEYALDPNVLLNWASNTRDYREFFREYGLGQPRIFSSFPKQKASKLRSYLLQSSPPEVQSLHSQRYTEMVEALVETIVIRKIPGDAPAVWHDHVVKESERLPFHAVITKEPLPIPGNMTPESMYKADSVWNHSRQLSVERTRERFLNILFNLLRYSSNKVVFVDAYGWRDDSIETISELIKASFLNKPSDKVPEFILHFKERHDRSNPNASIVKSRIVNRINLEIKLTVYELIESTTSDVLHNRCILSEHGGIIYGHGLDLSENYLHTDEAILMEKQIYEKKWNQFVENIVFDVQSKA